MSARFESLGLANWKYGPQARRRPASPVDGITPSIRKFIGDMLNTLYAHKGIGLSAPEVCQGLRLAVIDVRAVADLPSSLEVDGSPAEPESLMPLVLVNPEVLVNPIGQPRIAAETCMAFPGTYVEVSRSEEVVVRSLDREGRPTQFRCGGLLARVIQHAVDDLDGVPFLERRCLQVHEAAGLLAVSTQEALQLIEAGTLKGLNIGTCEQPRWRVPLPAIEEYVRLL